MKAITLHQPYASLVALGVKRIETRSWATKHRGRIAIHAGVKLPVRGEYGTFRVQDQGAVAGFGGLTPVLRYPGGGWIPLRLGAVVATADLVDCVPMVESLGPPGDGTEVIPPALLLHGLNDAMWLAPQGVNVEDQRPFGDFAPGRWAWLLDDIEPLTEPAPAKGKQGLWEWTP